MDCAALRASVRGEVVGREDVGYEARRRALVWNELRPPHRPAIIVAPADTADVVACVRYARTNGLRVAVRGGGHNWCGVAQQPDSLLLDLSGWRDVAVDPLDRSAVVQPGVRNLDLCQTLSAHGLAFPYGHCGSVALGGYLLSGGFGWNSGAWGPACFSVRGAEVVTADGDVVVADDAHNRDYFWALRGAGAAFFGVVTRYHLTVQPRPGAIAASTLVFPLGRLAALLAWLSDLVATLPPQVEVTLLATTPPPGLGGGELACVVEAWSFADNPEEAAATLAPLECGPEAGGCIASSVRRRLTFADLFAQMDRYFPAAQRYLADTFLSDAPATDLFGGLAGIVSRSPSPRSILLCIPVPPPPADAPAAPDMAFSIGGRFSLIAYAIWESPQDDQRNRDWHQQMVAHLEPFASCHYLGEVDLNRPSRVRRSFAPAHWERLHALRAKHDPQHLFHSVLDE